MTSWECPARMSWRLPDRALPRKRVRLNEGSGRVVRRSKRQVRGEHCRGCFNLWVVSDVVEHRHICPWHQFPVAGNHVCAGDWIESAVNEPERHVTPLEGAYPALSMLAAFDHIANESVHDGLAVVRSDQGPKGVDQSIVGLRFGSKILRMFRASPARLVISETSGPTGDSNSR